MKDYKKCLRCGRDLKKGDFAYCKICKEERRLFNKSYGGLR